ncbi:PaaI family thioesterase [Oceanobacillus damuensis]|uniref:PaaI family thioesterase n=1 Tax=Oceanobacillus damuensis TaxID=937928 RepID=UPI00082CB91C|nr:PaaI family thioesterase [Oceanobacillus damuensis]
MDLYNKSDLPIEIAEVINEYEKGPHWKLMDFKVQSIDKGSVSLKLPTREEFNNIKGTIHGGILAALLDTTMGMTAKTILKGTPITIQFNIQFLKPGIDEPLYSKSKVIDVGKSTCFLEGHIYNELKELIAYSTGTFKVN